MPTAEMVKDRTLDTIDLARERAEDLVHTKGHHLAAAAGRVVDEVREHRPDLDHLPAVEVPHVDELVQRASSHKVRTTVIISVVLVMLVLVVRKMTAHEPEPEPEPIIG
jgi:hypothetical protein